MSDGLTLLASNDEEQILAAQALTIEAMKFREELDDRLAAKIIYRLAQAMP